MTSRRQRVLTFGIVLGIVLALLGWVTTRPALSGPAGASNGLAGVQESEEQRLHKLALRDLKETQDEVARMKAHGIGMNPGSASNSRN